MQSGDDKSKEIEIVSEENIDHKRTISDINIRNIVHYAAVSIICIVTLSCVASFFIYDEATQKYDFASKTIFLVVGSVMGFLYGKKGG